MLKILFVGEKKDDRLWQFAREIFADYGKRISVSFSVGKKPVEYLDADGKISKSLCEKFEGQDYVLLQDDPIAEIRNDPLQRTALRQMVKEIRAHDAQAALIENRACAKRLKYEDMDDEALWNAISYEQFQLLRMTRVLSLPFGSAMRPAALMEPKCVVYDDQGNDLNSAAQYILALIIAMSICEKYRFPKFAPSDLTEYEIAQCRGLASCSCTKGKPIISSMWQKYDVALSERRRHTYYLSADNGEDIWTFYCSDYHGRFAHFVLDSKTVLPCGAAFSYDMEYWEWSGSRDAENQFTYAFDNFEYWAYFCRNIPYLDRRFEKFLIRNYLNQEVFTVNDQGEPSYYRRTGKGPKGILLSAPCAVPNGGGYVLEAAAQVILDNLPRDYYLILLPFNDIRTLTVEKEKFKNIYAALDFRTVDDEDSAHGLRHAGDKEMLCFYSESNNFVKTRKHCSFSLEFPNYSTDGFFDQLRAKTTGAAIAQVLLQAMRDKFKTTTDLFTDCTFLTKM